jgi:Arc/MetJ-type ribon-helix-helix transcriptional regulator
MAMVRKQKTVTHGLRYNAELNNRIQAATNKGGFSSHSAFIRAAIERELAGRESGVDAAEQRIAASLDRMAREIRNLRIGQQALFAFVDVLAKTFLTCVPEPPRDVHDQAVEPWQGPLRPISQERGHGNGGRFPGGDGRVVRTWPGMNDQPTAGDTASHEPEARGNQGCLVVDDDSAYI